MNEMVMFTNMNEMMMITHDDYPHVGDGYDHSGNEKMITPRQ